MVKRPYARTRSRGGFPYIPKIVGVEHMGGCPPVYTTSTYPCTNGQRDGYSETMTDVVTPGFSRKVAKGEMVFNYMKKVETLRQSQGSSTVVYTTAPMTCTPPARRTYTYTGDWVAYNLDYFNYHPGANRVLTAQATNDLQSQIWSEMHQDRLKGKANFLESLAEIEKTFKMLHSPLENVATFLKEWERSRGKRGRIRFWVYRTKAGLRLLSSEWLRYRYGINPLINDVKAAIQVVKSKYSGLNERVTTRKTGTLTKTAVTSLSFADGNATWPYQVTSLHEFKARAMAIDQYTRSPWNDLGFTFKNLVGLPWELTHFSFVADWFGNLGALIYANTPSLGAVSLGSCMSTIEDRRSVYSPLAPTGINTTLWFSISSPGGSYLCTERIKERSPNGPAFSPVINSDFRLDHFNRAADLVAIITQLSGRIHYEDFFRPFTKDWRKYTE